jgi:hypothetical protein
MENVIVVRGDPKDVHKLRAIYLLLYPDTEINVVQKPLHGPLPSIHQPRLRALDQRLERTETERRQGKERRIGSDRRKVVDLRPHLNRRSGADRRRGTERRLLHAM